MEVYHEKMLLSIYTSKCASDSYRTLNRSPCWSSQQFTDQVKRKHSVGDFSVPGKLVNPVEQL